MDAIKVKQKKYRVLIIAAVIAAVILLLFISIYKDKTPVFSVEELRMQSEDKVYTIAKDGMEYIFWTDGELTVKGNGPTLSFETMEEAKSFFLKELYKVHTGSFPKDAEQLTALNNVLDRVVLLSVEDGVTELGDSFCSPFYYLETVTLPESVKIIGNYAFLGAGQYADEKLVCYGLNKAVMQAEETSYLVTVTGEEVLSATTRALTENLEMVLREEEKLGTIPDMELLDVSVSMGNGTYLRLFQNGVLQVDGSYLSDFASVSALEDYLMEKLHCVSREDVKNLWFDRVAEIVLPKDLEYIGDYAFAGYRNLLAVTGGSVKKTGSRVFMRCGADRAEELLWKIDLEETILHADTFRNCKNSPVTEPED